MEYIEEDRGYGTPCWIWQGTLSVQGYAKVRTKDGLRQAQRVVYEREHGPIPDGHRLARHCEVRACVNPDHGEPVTRAEERLYEATPSWQAHQAGVCLKGHAMTPENTATLKDGTRICRTCRRAWQRAHYQRTAASESRTTRADRRRARELAAIAPDHREPGEPAPRVCPRGHAVVGANAKPDGHGSVTCRICANEAVRQWRERRKAGRSDMSD
jgi:hypothetical protein